MSHRVYGNSSRLNTDIAVISTDLDGKVTVFNQSASKLLGYIPQEVVGQSAPLVNFEILRDNLEEHKNIPNEGNFIHKDGSLVGMEVITSPINDVDGKLTGLLFTATKSPSEDDCFALDDLPNEAILDIVLEREINRTQREQQALTLLHIEVDFFDEFNNAYGDTEASLCLVDVAKVMNQRIQRASDFLAYIGNNTFYIILPNTNRSGAVKVAEQLRLLVKGSGIQHKASPHKVVTISIGIQNDSPDRETDLESFKESALKGIKQAQDEGGNCSRLA